jgi:intracellular sulfur oxidation DsrE/DsrF family protein
MIKKRITVLDSDIQKARQKMSDLEQQKIESMALLNALMGAKQQCDNFLQEIDNVEPEVSDSSDVDK